MALPPQPARRPTPAPSAALRRESAVVLALLDDAVGHPDHHAVQADEERRERSLEEGPRARVVAPRSRDEQVAEEVGRAEKVAAVQQVVEEAACHLVRREELVEHLRPDVPRLVRLGLLLLLEAWCVHVGGEGDVELHRRVRVLVAQHVEQRAARSLGGGVRGVPDEGDGRNHRRDGDEVRRHARVGGRPLRHLRQHVPRRVQHAVVVDGHHALVVGDAELLKVLRHRRPRRSDAHVHRTELRLGLLDRRAERGAVADVAAEDAHRGAGRRAGELIARSVQLAHRARHQRDACAPCRGDLGHLEADALRAARDEHVLA
mmetsp:Transcript_13337/g.42816  ORF Transcript_13337/g.42816 Transcript_13337/m.42816 type:complete len:318 (+) Transcript_13337:184-1137(+)